MSILLFGRVPGVMFMTFFQLPWLLMMLMILMKNLMNKVIVVLCSGWGLHEGHTLVRSSFMVACKFLIFLAFRICVLLFTIPTSMLLF